jgi:hypothetical protein
MELPEYLKIGPFNYKLDLHEGYWNKDDERVYGEVDERNCTINLDIDASPEIIRESVLHEVVHAILMMYERDDEELVRLLTPMLLQVLQDNPKLVNALAI